MTEFGRPYHKINSAFKRDTSVPGNPVIQYDWAQPEFGYLQHQPWNWTEKIHGTNIRLYWNGETVTLGGRTDRAQIPATITEAIRNLGVLDDNLWQKKWPYDGEERPSVTLFGEGYGPGIQKGGGLYREDVSFILFDVRIGNWWLTRENVELIAEGFGLDIVPQFGTEPMSPTDMWRAIKDGQLHSARFPDAPLEGVVGTPAVPLLGRDGHRVIMKLKQRDWDEYQKVRAAS